VVAKRNRARESELGSRRPALLVVEDEALARNSVSEEMREFGYAVIEAANAGEAVAILAAEHVDAVFSDIYMPGPMNGLELAAWIRFNFPSTPVVLTSGYAAARAYAAPVSAYFFAKPYKASAVCARIRGLLDEIRTGGGE